jgi:hypothetical protein
VTSRRLGSSSVEVVEEATEVGAVAEVSSVVGTVAPSVLDGGVFVASFDRTAPEDSLLGDAVLLPSLVAVDVDASGVDPAEREASPCSGVLEVVALPASATMAVEVAGVGLAEREASPCSGVSRLGPPTFSVLKPMVVFVLSMLIVDVVCYLPHEEGKRKWKAGCALGGGRGAKRDGR